MSFPMPWVPPLGRSRGRGPERPPEPVLDLASMIVCRSHGVQQILQMAQSPPKNPQSTPERHPRVLTPPNSTSPTPLLQEIASEELKEQTSELRMVVPAAQQRRERPVTHPAVASAPVRRSCALRCGPQVQVVREKVQNARSGGVGAELFDEVAAACSAAFESEQAPRCADAVALFNAAMAKAGLGAIRSPSVASAVAMLVSLLRSPSEPCRRSALECAAGQLDGIQLLRSVLRGMGGTDTCRRWQAAANSLLALRLILVGCGKGPAERLRNAGCLPLVLEIWRSGGHNADVAQECCGVTLLLAHGASKQAALAGATDCAMATWQRFGSDSSRGTLTQGLVETMLLCLPHLNERPERLPRLTVESLRTLQNVGPTPAVIWLVKALARLAGEPKLAHELNGYGVADLVLGILSDERWGQELVMRRFGAEAFAKPLSIVNGAAKGSSMVVAVAPGSFSGYGSSRYQELPSALPTASEALLAEACGQELAAQPTLAASACASALVRRLTAWRARLLGSSGGPHAGSAGYVAARESEETPALEFDADFESGSLGPVTRIGPGEYEISLVSDTSGDGSGDYVQWFCFRLRNMRVGQVYTFHLGNLIKPGSLFEEGCQPVMFSRRRRELEGAGWTREGSDVAYYPYHDLGRRHCVSFDLQFPYEEDEVFLAHAPPYSYSDHLVHLARWPNLQRYALLPTRADRHLCALKLGDPAAPYQACLVARAHPGETHASWVMRGALDFLLGGSEEAKRCFEGVRWVVVPMLNPDGVACGRTRTNLDGVDLNRHHHDDSAPETRGLRQLLQEEVRTGRPLAFVDIHSHSRRRGVFAIANGSDGDPLIVGMGKYSRLLDVVGAARAEVKARDEGVGRVAAARLGYRYSVTLESSLCARHAAAGNQHLTLHDLLEVGRAVCLGIADVVGEQAGSRGGSRDSEVALAPNPEDTAYPTTREDTLDSLALSASLPAVAGAA